MGLPKHNLLRSAMWLLVGTRNHMLPNTWTPTLENMYMYLTKRNFREALGLKRRKPTLKEMQLNSIMYKRITMQRKSSEVVGMYGYSNLNDLFTSTSKGVKVFYEIVYTHRVGNQKLGYVGIYTLSKRITEVSGTERLYITPPYKIVMKTMDKHFTHSKNWGAQYTAPFAKLPPQFPELKIAIDSTDGRMV